MAVEETLLKYSSFYIIIIIIFCRLSPSLQQTKNRRTEEPKNEERNIDRQTHWAHTHIHICCIYFANSQKSFQFDFVGTVICTIGVNLPDTAKWKSFTRCLNGVRLHFHGTFVVCIIFVLFNGRVLCEKFFLFSFFFFGKFYLITCSECVAAKWRYVEWSTLAHYSLVNWLVASIASIFQIK